MVLNPINRQILSHIDEIYCLPNEMFLTNLYISILGRPADDKGLEHYIKLLEQGMPRFAIISEFLTCKEAIEKGFNKKSIPLKWKLERFFIGANFKKLIFWLLFPLKTILRQELGRVLNQFYNNLLSSAFSPILNNIKKTELDLKFKQLEEICKADVENKMLELSTHMKNKILELEKRNRTLERQLRLFQSTWLNQPENWQLIHRSQNVEQA